MGFHGARNKAEDQTWAVAHSGARQPLLYVLEGAGCYKMAVTLNTGRIV